MLDSFQIRNFRLFQDLTIKRLGRVNLIVGKNNTGKSAFLEAVELYASNASYRVLIDLIETRQETWCSDLQSHVSDWSSHPVRHLFFGRKLPGFEKEGISLGEVSSNPKLHITTGVYRNEKDDKGTITKINFPHDGFFNPEGSNIEIFLIAEEGEETRRLLRLDRSARELLRYSETFYEREKSEFKDRWPIVSTVSRPNRQLANLWDSISLTDLESEVIAAMGRIDERVSKIAFVEDMSRNDWRNERNKRIPLVKLKGIDERLPLKSLGDGMTRLFHIILALVNARKGLLLIDEFDNDLHWKVQPKVWDIVFQLSENLDIQVFATTHSRDCIEGFDSVWKNYPEQGAFFRLDAKGESIKATEYTSETLSDAIEMDVEVG